MGLTTEEENVCFYFFFFFGREEGQKDALADGGSEKAGLADLATVGRPTKKP